MPYKKQLEELSNLARKFDACLLQSNNNDVLSLSFFSQSYDLLKEMMSLLHDMEEVQVERMKYQLDLHKMMISEWVSTEEAIISSEIEPLPFDDLKTQPLADPVPVARTFKIAINDRFLIQRELFAGNNDEMIDIMNYLGSVSTMKEALVYLDNRFKWNWEEEAPSVFKGILERYYV